MKGRLGFVGRFVWNQEARVGTIRSAKAQRVSHRAMVMQCGNDACTEVTVSVHIAHDMIYSAAKFVLKVLG